MKLLTTLSNIVGSFCILAIAMLIVLLIWGVYPAGEFVWKMLFSLGTVYICMLLLGNSGNTTNHSSDR